MSPIVARLTITSTLGMSSTMDTLSVFLERVVAAQTAEPWGMDKGVDGRCSTPWIDVVWHRNEDAYRLRVVESNGWRALLFRSRAGDEDSLVCHDSDYDLELLFPSLPNHDWLREVLARQPMRLR
ncbi:MAG: hypothetical protein K8H88_00370 [Sandaracinaceae bacterium]|nr:hypothetical protein [Sandaracinaceae bacterium]